MWITKISEVVVAEGSLLGDTGNLRTQLFLPMSGVVTCPQRCFLVSKHSCSLAWFLQALWMSTSALLIHIQPLRWAYTFTVLTIMCISQILNCIEFLFHSPLQESDVCRPLQGNLPFPEFYRLAEKFTDSVWLLLSTGWGRCLPN